jgi:hypothetical protein
MPVTRRDWMRMACGAAIGASITGRVEADAGRTFCLFSKHLPELDWSALALATRDAGFGGVDLTVRPGGHVLPERAPDDLPRAIDAIRAAGLRSR